MFVNHTVLLTVQVNSITFSFILHQRIEHVNAKELNKNGGKTSVPVRNDVNMIIK